MIFPKRNQKQVAERLRGNLDYYNRRRPWRTWRWWVSALSIVGGVAAVPAFYYFRGPESVMNPGPISRAHAAIANNCAACHPQTGMIRADSQQAGRILHAEYFVPIDQACRQCHPGYDFHARNVAPDPTRPVGTGARNEASSCTSCHREHITAGKMLPSTDQNCAACHNRTELMAASSELGRKLFPPPDPHIQPRRVGDLIIFAKNRPPEGFKKTFPAFDQGHPAFQIETQHLQDPDTLRYGHARHEAANIPNTELKKRLDCAYCHQPDGKGAYFQKITFEKNCMACHALAFDPEVAPNLDARDPGVVIPHGNAEQAFSFLTGLRSQYYLYRMKIPGVTPTQARDFANDSVTKLAATYGVSPRDEAGLAAAVYNRVFFYVRPGAEGPNAINDGGNRGQQNRNFLSCKACHPVGDPVLGKAPSVTKPLIVDRWLPDGRFDHSKHQEQSKDVLHACDKCHASVHTSEKTSDINLPTQLSCTECHRSGPGGVANQCSSCHGYHNDPNRRTVKGTEVTPATTIDPKLLASLPGPRPTLRDMLRVKAATLP